VSCDPLALALGHADANGTTAQLRQAEITCVLQKKPCCKDKKAPWMEGTVSEWWECSHCHVDSVSWSTCTTRRILHSTNMSTSASVHAAMQHAATGLPPAARARSWTRLTERHTRKRRCLRTRRGREVRLFVHALHACVLTIRVLTAHMRINHTHKRSCWFSGLTRPHSVLPIFGISPLLCALYHLSSCGHKILHATQAHSGSI